MTRSQPAPSPRYHFTPEHGWLNDPNGLVYQDGEYHLFYQHHPDSTSWGPMHWGHAVSPDLHQWQHLPVALRPDELGMVFSGSAVVDRHNTAGFGANALIAVFTHFVPGREAQSLAYSHDHGRTWTKYPDNPVLHSPTNATTFRDPKVFWHSTEDGPGYWTMVLAVGSEIWFYRSPDLRHWEWTGRFASSHVSGRYETPDLFRLPIEGTNQTRWVLTFGSGIEDDAGTTTRYVIGDFDGQVFTPDDSAACPRRGDQGPDFYAAQSWNNEPNSERVWLAWMNNWAYAEDVPASGWRGMMTVPRRLTLQQGQEGLLLGQQPILGAGWHHYPVGEVTDLAPDDREHLVNLVDLPAAVDLRVTIDCAHSQGDGVTLELWKAGEQAARLTYDLRGQRLHLDRSTGRHGPGCVPFRVHSTASVAGHERVGLRVLVDTASIEVFAANGTVAMSAQCFPASPAVTLRLRELGGPIDIHGLQVDVAHV